MLWGKFIVVLRVEVKTETNGDIPAKPPFFGYVSESCVLPNK